MNYPQQFMKCTQQNHTPEDLLLAYIFGEYAVRVAEVSSKPLSEITISDLPIIKQMPIPPNNIITFDMKSRFKRSGRLEVTQEMKNNLVRFAKENIKEYIQKSQKQNTNIESNPNPFDKKYNSAV